MAVRRVLLLSTFLVLCACKTPVSPTPYVAPASFTADESLQRYTDAARSVATGTVAGKVYEERAKPNAADRPLPGTIVILLPRSATVLEALTAVKAEARASIAGYRDAATTIRKVREAYERALWEAGGADLVMTTAVDADGRFRVDGIPEGAWILYASRSALVEKVGEPPSARDQETFVKRPQFLGYYRVSVWLREMTVAAGGWQTIDLTDRTVWFTGVAEDWDTVPKPRGTPTPARRP